jgi:hypothetical protein
MAEHACTTPEQTKSSRRALLGGLMAAPVALVAVGAAPRAEQHPDGELLALVDEWRRQAAACDAANKIEIEAEDRCVWPDPPEPLFAREGDSRLFWSRLPSLRHDVRRDDREWWGPQIDFFRSHRLIREGARHPGARDPNFGARKTRAAAIVTAYDEWHVEQQRVAKESGYADAEANARVLYEANTNLRARILEPKQAR